MSWGNFLNIYSDCKYELNELKILPNRFYSSQKKGKIFVIIEGEIHLYKINLSSDFEPIDTYKKGTYFSISDNRQIHLTNETDEVVKILEINLIDT